MKFQIEMQFKKVMIFLKKEKIFRKLNLQQKFFHLFHVFLGLQLKE